jgi:hypothetical protein
MIFIDAIILDKRNKMILKEKLQQLITSKQIHSYTLLECIKDETDREVDVLELIFPSGEKLKLTTFCSGCSEGSCFMLINE